MNYTVIAKAYKEPITIMTSKRKIKKEFDYIMSNIAWYKVVGTTKNTIALESATIIDTTYVFTNVPTKWINNLIKEADTYKASKGYKINGKWVIAE